MHVVVVVHLDVVRVVRRHPVHAAALKPFLGLGRVFPEPVVWPLRAGHGALGVDADAHEALAAVLVARVDGEDAELLHGVGNLHVVGEGVVHAHGVLAAVDGLAQGAEGGLAHDRAGAAAVKGRHLREAPAEEVLVRGLEVREELLQVVHHKVRVVVRADEPVGLVKVVVVRVHPGQLALLPQVVARLVVAQVQHHRVQARHLLRRDKEQHVAVGAPRLGDGLGLGRVVLRVGHHPAHQPPVRPLRRLLLRKQVFARVRALRRRRQLLRLHVQRLDLPHLLADHVAGPQLHRRRVALHIGVQRRRHAQPLPRHTLHHPGRQPDRLLPRKLPPLLGGLGVAGCEQQLAVLLDVGAVDAQLEVGCGNLPCRRDGPLLARRAAAVEGVDLLVERVRRQTIVGEPLADLAGLGLELLDAGLLLGLVAGLHWRRRRGVLLVVRVKWPRQNLLEELGVAHLDDRLHVDDVRDPSLHLHLLVGLLLVGLGLALSLLDRVCRWCCRCCRCCGGRCGWQRVLGLRLRQPVMRSAAPLRALLQQPPPAAADHQIPLLISTSLITTLLITRLRFPLLPASVDLLLLVVFVVTVIFYNNRCRSSCCGGDGRALRNSQPAGRRHHHHRGQHCQPGPLMHVYPAC
eukprot:m.211691 g.211691  ORF g.211691 m.211691 type:complete len:631 (-) comp18729_c0_seq1:91-1983(-)